MERKDSKRFSLANSSYNCDINSIKTSKKKGD